MKSLKASSLLCISIAGIAAIGISSCGGSGGSSSTPSTISQLSVVKQVACTIAPNGDQNPYGLATPPPSYTTTSNVLQPGDILITDFSNSTGANTGTSIMRYSPSSGSISLFYSETVGVGPVAVAISPLGSPWIANYDPGYTNPFDGASTGDGNVLVITPNGKNFPNNVGIIDNNSGATFNPTTSKFAGPWGQALGVYKTPSSTIVEFFVTQVEDGAVQRQNFVPGHFNSETVTTLGYLPSGTNAFDPTGPQGMVYDPKTDTLYVASTQDNAIYAFPCASTISSTITPIKVYQGSPLDAPLGLTMNPINGDLITVNQLNNNMVEIAPNMQSLSQCQETFSPQVVAVKQVDSVPVNASNTTGSALFGVLATTYNGNLVVYYTDSNYNTLNVLCTPGYCPPSNTQSLAMCTPASGISQPFSP